MDFLIESETSQFTHSEVSLLYYFNSKIPEKILNEILALPKKSLVNDLEKLLELSFQNYEKHARLDANGWGSFQALHAFYLLTELGSASSYNLIVLLLKEDSGKRDFWFGDHLNQYFWQYFYAVASQKKIAIEKGILNPNYDDSLKLAMASGIATYYTLHPELREEALKFWGRLIKKIVALELNDPLRDPELISYTLYPVIEGKWVELLPLLEKLYKKDLLYDGLFGDWDEIVTEISDSTPPTPEMPVFTLMERYAAIGYLFLEVGEEEEEERWGDGEMGRRGEEERWGDLEMGREGELGILSELYGGGLFKEGQMKNENKVGRNDPCPCQSGKKYKKCCGYES